MARLPGRPFAFVRRHWVLGGLLLLGVLAGLGYVGSRHVRAWRHYQVAERALERRDFRQARANLALCLQVWPASRETHLLAAQAARRAGAYDNAAYHLNVCEQLHGPSEAAQLERALLSAQRGELAGVDDYLVS